MLNIENLVCESGGKKIVNRLFLTLAKGEIGAVMGKNGVGKSTLLKAVAGFIPLKNGSICFDGNVLSTCDWTEEPARRGIGMVFQDMALFPHISAKDNLLFGLYNLSNGEKKSRLEELVQLIHAEELLEKYPYELSGGEQQRIAIGRTLITKSPLMLFDEPFANLDVSLKRELSFSVRDFLKKNEITSLVVSHDKAEAINICDRIGEMREGVLSYWHDKRDTLLDNLSDLLPQV